jgi:hypothetical protein
VLSTDLGDGPKFHPASSGRSAQSVVTPTSGNVNHNGNDDNNNSNSSTSSTITHDNLCELL